MRHVSGLVVCALGLWSFTQRSSYSFPLKSITEKNRPQGAGQDLSEKDQGLDVKDLSLDDLLRYKVTSTTLGVQTAQTAPSTVTLISAQQIKALGLKTLRDLLELVAGVTILDSHTGEEEVALRAVATSANILVTLDGQPLNNFYDGSFFPNLTLANVDYIEIIRGPGSALYGTNAFSGVISIFSKGAGTEGSSEGEANAYFDMNLDDKVGVGGNGDLRYSTALGEWTLNFFGSYRRTTGPKVLVEDDKAKGLPYSKVPGNTNGFFQASLIQASLGKRKIFTEHDTFELGSIFIYQDRGPFLGLGKNLATESDLSRLVTSNYATYSAALTPRLSLKTLLSFDAQMTDNKLEV